METVNAACSAREKSADTRNSNCIAVSQVDIRASVNWGGEGVRMLSRRGVLVGLLATAGVPAWAEAPKVSPRPKPRGKKQADGGTARLVEAAKLTGAVSYFVADAASGQVLDAGDNDNLMAPASVIKAVTTLFALEKLGLDYRFVTRVMARGVVTNGRLDGDLILAGGGDPGLDTDRLGDLAAALAATGLREVTGKLIAYTGALPQRFEIAPDQPDYVGYNPAMSGLILNYNRVNFVWKAENGGYQLAMNAEGTRFVPPISSVTMATAERDLPLFGYTADVARDHWTVSRGALGKEGGRWLPVRHPGHYAGEVFQWLCRAQGIKLPPAEISTTLPEEAVELVRQHSEPLPEVLRKMLKYSTNLTAEVVGLAASGAASQEASAAQMTTWAQQRFGIAGVFGDHSGLGPVSRIKASDMMKVMLRAPLAKNGELLAELMRNQGLPDENGKEQKDADIVVQAKSGTMNFVSNLAGYVAPPQGRRLVFAIFTGDLPRRAAVPEAQRESPEGDAAWVKRSRKLQKQLLRRWALAFA